MNIIESQLQTALLLLAPKRIPNLRLFRRNIIKVRLDNNRAVRAGIKGQADLYGYWRGGKTIELELKSSTGRSTPEQLAWASFCAAWGVQHLVLKARKDESVQETAERWCLKIASLC